MAVLDLVERQLLAGQVLLHQRVVVLDRRLDHLVPGLLDALLVGVGHRHLGEGLAEGLLVEDELDPAQHVDVPGEGLPGADRQLEREGLLGQAAPDHRQAAVEVGAHPVHLVREDDPRDAVPVGLPPDGLRLRLDAGHRVQQRHRAVQHPQRPLDLDREVHVAGRVDDVDPVQHAVAGPETGRGGGGDGDAPLLLLLHPVHRGRALVDLTDLVVLAGVVQDALGRRRLPGIDVRHDADVAVQFERRCTRHYGPCLWPTFSEKAGRPTRAPARWYRSAHVRASSPRRGTSKGSLAVSSEDQRWLADWPPSRGPIVGEPRVRPSCPACDVPATSGSGRTRGWPRPSGACLPSS